MSRTIKDAPDWVKRNRVTNRAHPDHEHFLWRGEEVHCDIDEPLRAHNKTAFCGYEPAEGAPNPDEHGPKKDEVREKYWAPERAHVRNQLHRTVRTVNGGGEADNLVLPRNHRHHLFARGTGGGGDYWD